MKKLLLLLAASTILFACKHGGSEEKLIVKSLNYYGCNSSIPLYKSVVYECVNYKYENSFLKISRKNASLNCASDSMIINLQQSGNFITVSEKEHYNTPANCQCLSNFDYTIGPVDKKSYTLIINTQSGAKMSFAIDLATKTDGEYCEVRTGYPWD